MGYVGTVLAATAEVAGRAQRRTTVRHVHLADHQLGLVVLQMAHEPFSAVAVGMGTARDDLNVAVIVEPRNPVLLYHAMTPLAQMFCRWFRAPAQDTETIVRRNGRRMERATGAPQILVPNRSTVDVLRRWGRRFAYLSTDGEFPIDAALPEFGSHLQFLADHAEITGQALVVPATTLLRRHWVTAQSDMEDENLAALDAWIEPPAGLDGFVAASRAEDTPVGPLLQPSDENEIFELIAELNAVRKGSTEPRVVARLRRRLEPLCRGFIEPAWELLWRVVDRERGVTEGAHVERRWGADRQAYSDQLEWVDSGRRRRARDSIRRAIALRSRLEEAQASVEAEEAMDDPLVMAEFEVAGKAFTGEVVTVDDAHREQGPVRQVSRPLIEIETEDPCLMALGREVWWAANAKLGGVVHATVPTITGGSRVTVKVTTGMKQSLPGVGVSLTFCSLNMGGGPWMPLPQAIPWTHQPPEDSDPAAIDQSGAPSWEQAPDA